MHKRASISKTMVIATCLFLISGFLLNSYSLVFVKGVFAQSSSSDETEELKNQLRQELEKIQNQIAQYQEQINQKRQEVESLQREIFILNTQIKKAELEIHQTELAIQETDLTINEINKKMADIEQKIDKERERLAEYIRLIYEYDQNSLLEIILKEGNFSDFFEQIQAFENINKVIQETIKEVRGLRKDLEKQKNQLEDKKEDYLELKRLQNIQKISINKQKIKKRNLLAQTRGQEKLYQKMIEKGYKDIQMIKNQLYLLEGIGVSMTLEQALGYARLAGARTGVRPAFLLAVLKKESSWGKNVGTGHWYKDMYQCYIKLGKRTKAEREKNAFLQIVRELNLDPDTVQVSAEPYYGCGGAMGAAQFMPTTWLAYKERVANLTGHHPPSPWNIGDAFTAAAIKLADAGASQRSYQSEWKAAMIYFAGRNWNNPIYRFYGDSVMELAKVIQEQVNLIGK